MSHPGATASDRHKVVIIGSGFGGLNAAQKLKRADVDIKLIARTTHHLFQPLLYQVATGIISEGEIAPPDPGDPAQAAATPRCCSATSRTSTWTKQDASTRSCSATPTRRRTTA